MIYWCKYCIHQSMSPIFSRLPTFSYIPLGHHQVIKYSARWDRCIFGSKTMVSYHNNSLYVNRDSFKKEYKDIFWNRLILFDVKAKFVLNFAKKKLQPLLFLFEGQHPPIRNILGVWFSSQPKRKHILGFFSTGGQPKRKYILSFCC